MNNHTKEYNTVPENIDQLLAAQKTISWATALQNLANRAVLTVEAKSLLNIILNPLNDPVIPEIDRIEFLKNELLKPENTELLNVLDDCITELVDKNYVPVRPGSEPIIPSDTFLEFLNAIARLDQMDLPGLRLSSRDC